MNIKISVTMSEVKISKENLIKSYNEADKATKKMLETIFGKDMFQPKNIMERVKTFEDAVKVLGNDHALVRTYNSVSAIDDNNLHAYLKLQIIIAALNEDWIPPQDCETDVWYCWHWLYTKDELDDMSNEEKASRHMLDITGKYHGPSCGFGRAYSSYAPSLTYAFIGSLLCFKTRELAEYCGKQFIDLWAEFRLI